MAATVAAAMTIAAAATFLMGAGILSFAGCTRDFEAPFAQTPADASANSPDSGSQQDANANTPPPFDPALCPYDAGASTPAIGSTPYSDLITSAEPRAYYRLDEATGDFVSTVQSAAQPRGVRAVSGDGSLSSRPGAIASPDSSLATSIRNATISFGDAFGEIGSSTFTIELWIRVTAAGANEQLVLSKEHGVADPLTRAGFRLAIVGGALRFSRFPGVLQNVKAITDLERPLEVNRWHHVALRQSDDFTTLIVDGVAAPEKEAPGSFVTTADPFVLGSAVIDAAIDELVFYSRALTTDEIRSHINAAASSSCNDKQTDVCLGFDQVARCSAEGIPIWTKTCDEACGIFDGSAACGANPCR